MLTYIIRRLLLMIPTLIGVTMLVFFIMAKAPGGFEMALNEGNQSMGEEARRIQQELTNRYALDKPTHVQYFRWLNQVSPVGFRMTSDYDWPEAEQEELIRTLQQQPWIEGERDLEAKRAQILTIAIYSKTPPKEVVEAFAAAAEDPVSAGPKLFEWLESEPLGEQDFWNNLQETANNDHDRAVFNLFNEVRYGTMNRSRVMFSSVKFWEIDLGTSRNNRDVGDLIIERLPITLVMNLITLPLIYVVSIVAGTLAARRRGGFFDVASGVVMLGLYSVPVILAGTLMIAYLANSQYLRWFPASGVHDLQADRMPFLPYFEGGTFNRGYLFDFAWHMVLPITCLTYAGFAYLTKVMRGSVLETISADFVRTARAKGLPENNILFRHVLRNSLLPLITMAAAILPSLFVGSFVVEYIFSIQGMGLLTINAAKNADINIVMATTLVGSVLSLLSLLLRDLLYAFADPRVTYD